MSLQEVIGRDDVCADSSDHLWLAVEEVRIGVGSRWCVRRGGRRPGHKRLRALAMMPIGIAKLKTFLSAARHYWRRSISLLAYLRHLCFVVLWNWPVTTSLPNFWYEAADCNHITAAQPLVTLVGCGSTCCPSCWNQTNVCDEDMWSKDGRQRSATNVIMISSLYWHLSSLLRRCLCQTLLTISPNCSFAYMMLNLKDFQNFIASCDASLRQVNILYCR